MTIHSIYDIEPASRRDDAFPAGNGERTATQVADRTADTPGKVMFPLEAAR